jgi:hypothetical protein
MLCAYLTLDEVNQDVAERLALQAGVELEAVSPRDMLAARTFDALVVDLDSLPPGYRKAVFADFLAGRNKAAAAVHSYHLRIRDARVLHRRGVIVGRRLDEELFRRLHEAVVTPKRKITVSPRVTHYDE